MLIRSKDIEPNEFIKLITDEDILVYEDVQASKIWVNYVNGNWLIRPKSVNQNPLNMIDLAVQKYYKYAYAYLLSLPDQVTDLLRPNMYFCFEYFPDEQPANIKYTRVPNNFLILTCICKYKKNYIYNYDELKIYSDLLNVETLPLIYKGRLNDKQIQSINLFLHTSKNDLHLFFKDDINFSKFFYKLLNPNTESSYLNDDFQQNLEKIIIRFIKSDKEYTLEILNPLYQKQELIVQSEYSDVYSILLFNFMQYLLTVDLDILQIEGTSRELIYINLMSKLYNMYMEKNEHNILDFIFTVPDFFNSDKFRINQVFIKNETTLDYINKNNKFEYVFKIILYSFKYKHKKCIGIFNNTTVQHLNNLIKKIHIKIEEQLNYNNKLSKYSYQLKNLKSYPNIAWEQDYKGYVFPEVVSLFGDYQSEDKKKQIKK
jgi:hypothetical protein